MEPLYYHYEPFYRVEKQAQTPGYFTKFNFLKAIDISELDSSLNDPTFLFLFLLQIIMDPAISTLK